MKIIYNKKDKTSDLPTEGKENRFFHLINRLDLKDQGLDPVKRKRKWIVILAGIFVLYLLSFLFPSPKLSHHSLDAEKKPITKDSLSKGNAPNAQKPLTFEMPVDSFENILKSNIHEKLSKTK